MAKKVAKRIGRPPADDPKVPINCRVPLSLRKRCEKAAKAARISFPQWVRDSLDAASRK